MSNCYSQITLAERRRLFELKQLKLPLGDIARLMGRHRSTIYREIKRNSFRDAEIPDYNGYHSVVADNISKDRRTRLRKLRRYPELRKFVIEQLEAHWSPEQICGRLISHGLSAIRLCAETIYRFIYSKEEYGLKLYEHLAEMRTKRCPRGTRRSRSSRIPEAFRIHQRPDFIGNRLQFGNWEGDLIIFDRDLGEANVMTLVERKSRYCVIIKNSSRHSKPIMNKIIQAFAALPYHARRSFTFDRGSEFMGYRALEDGMGARSWFCDPNSPWQKGTIENINKRIRRYLPSNTDLTQVSQAQLTALAHKLNATPRKCLGFKTPAEVFAKLLQEAA